MNPAVAQNTGNGYKSMEQDLHRRNRVLMVSNFLSVAGTSRGACEDLADHLEQSGWSIIRTSHKAPKLARLADMLSTTWQRRHDYDVAQVDLYSGAAFVWAEFVCRLLRSLRKPYVLTLHGGHLPRFAAAHPRRVRRLLQSAAAVTTPSNYLQQAMSPYRDGLRLIPNSLDIDRYTFRYRPSPAPRLVWLRSLHRIYNPVMAVQVLAGVRHDFPGAQLTMVGPDKGDGSHQAVCRAAESLGVSDALTLTGVVDKSAVPNFLSAADIFLNTTNADNTPISVIEAMACGLPVVSTNVGGLPYLIDDRRTGLLVAPNQPQAMIAAVKQVLTEPELAGSLSKRARAATECFDWNATLPRWQEILASTAGQC